MHIGTVVFLSMQFFVKADWIPIPNLKDNEMAVVKSQKKSDPYNIGNSLYFSLFFKQGPQQVRIELKTNLRVCFKSMGN